VCLGVGWYLLGSPVCQRARVSLGAVLATLIAREGGGRLDHNSVLQLLKSFRHLMSFFGSSRANSASWGCQAVTVDIKAGNGIRL